MWREETLGLIVEKSLVLLFGQLLRVPANAVLRNRLLRRKIHSRRTAALIERRKAVGDAGMDFGMQIRQKPSARQAAVQEVAVVGHEVADRADPALVAAAIMLAALLDRVDRSLARVLPEPRDFGVHIFAVDADHL